MNSLVHEQGWSVEIALRSDERVAIDYAGPRVVGPERYVIIRPWEDEEQATTVSIDVTAPSAGAAEERALRLYQEMRALAELAPDRAPKVMTVARIAGRPRPWDRYIFAAVEMMRQGQYALAVIAAQIHCEMFVRHALTSIAQHDGSRVALATSDLLRSCSLMDRDGPQIFEALLGVGPKSAPCWTQYSDHVSRRNRVVHHGAPVTGQEAQDSLDVAVEMVRFVDECLQERLAPKGRT